jgi:hypothetical protein
MCNVLRSPLRQRGAGHPRWATRAHRGFLALPPLAAIRQLGSRFLGRAVAHGGASRRFAEGNRHDFVSPIRRTGGTRHLRTTARRAFRLVPAEFFTKGGEKKGSGVFFKVEAPVACVAGRGLGAWTPIRVVPPSVLASPHPRKGPRAGRTGAALPIPLPIAGRLPRRSLHRGGKRARGRASVPRCDACGATNYPTAIPRPGVLYRPARGSVPRTGRPPKGDHPPGRGRI